MLPFLQNTGQNDSKAREGKAAYQDLSPLLCKRMVMHLCLRIDAYSDNSDAIFLSSIL